MIRPGSSRRFRRAIRFSLRTQELFRVQLRAILRASTPGNLRILIPMITEIEEVGEVKAIFEEVKAEGKAVTRENLIRKGNELRERFGPGILGAKMAQKVQKDKNYVIDSIRNPAEATARPPKRCCASTSARHPSHRAS